MRLAFAAQMRHVDQQVSAEYGLAEVVLMENAGREVAREVETLIAGVAGKKVCLFCGKGNNGGDGFVAARHLANLDARVYVFLLGARQEVVGAARSNLDILLKQGIEVVELSGERDWHRAGIAATFADCLVDALLGTGFHGEPDSSMGRLINLINQSAKPVVAVDIPSGVHADSGQTSGAAVAAARTVSFGLAKPGHFLYPGRTLTGQLRVEGIGIPVALLNAAAPQLHTVSEEYVRQILPVRAPDAHKGTCGRVCVIAGSRGLSGAAALAATAAARAGAGLVTLGVAASLQDGMAAKLTEVMTRPLPETPDGALGPKAWPHIVELLEKADVLAIGPGLGTAPETFELVRQIVREIELPIVLDADALNALAGYRDLLPEARALPVLTPHPGEMARLIGLSPADINQDRLYVARETAKETGSVVVLKGAPTIIAYPDGETYINTTGNPAMATGGMGDALTGLIAALIGQGMSSQDAAVAGVYLHGLAGDIAARERPRGLLAHDVIEALPAAFASVLVGVDAWVYK